MLSEYLQLRTLSIILVGDFNPSIIQPFWLASKKLIKNQEADQADVELIHSELSRFELDWVFIEVTKTKFELRSSKEPYFEAVRDLAIGIFTYLSETPVRAGGINHHLHFAMPDNARYYQVGNSLGKLSNWANFMNDPRMLRLDILENERKDKNNGSYRVIVQPSDQLSTAAFPLSITLNDHIDAKKGDKVLDSNVIKILASIWDNSFKRSYEIMDAMWESITQNDK